MTKKTTQQIETFVKDVLDTTPKGNWLVSDYCTVSKRLTSSRYEINWPVASCEHGRPSDDEKNATFIASSPKIIRELCQIIEQLLEE